MKRIIKMQDVEPLHLSDILERITHIIICEDINSTYGMISASSEFENDGEDMDDEQFYLTLSDSNLLELSDAEIHAISNIELIGRIAKLDIDRLSLQQRKALREAYGKKTQATEADIENLLKMLRDCNSISYERRHRKTNKFLTDSSGRLKESECLELLHQLTLGDYVATSKSYNPNHIGNQLFIFEPNATWETDDGTVLENIVIYIKLDIDESTKTSVALVSMHEAEYADHHPYR